MTLIFRLAGRARRTPHEYRATDRLSFRPKQRLLNTNECVHASVRIRMGLRGYGYDDKGFYDSQGLEGWTMEGTEVESPPSSAEGGEASPLITAAANPELGSMRDVKWVKRAHQNGEHSDFKHFDMVMPEDELGELEREILKSWPDVEKGFALIRPGAHPLRMLKSSTDPVKGSPRRSNVALEAGTGRNLHSMKPNILEIERAKKSPTI